MNQNTPSLEMDHSNEGSSGSLRPLIILDRWRISVVCPSQTHGIDYCSIGCNQWWACIQANFRFFGRSRCICGDMEGY